MKNNNYDNEREYQRIFLTRFFINLENNHFDRFYNKNISKIENELESLTAKKKTLFGREKSELNLEINFLEHELFAITEMKINYAYKHFEFYLKLLIKISYDNVNGNQLFKWEFVRNYLKTRNIKIENLDNYTEINELREVNNSIKHSNNILNDKTKKITEFKGYEKITYKQLAEFYEKRHNSSILFLKSLSNKISSDLYEFDDDKLNKISEKFSKRMNSETLTKFIEKLKKE